MDLSYRDIVDLVKIVAASGFREFTLQTGSTRLSVSRGPAERDSGTTDNTQIVSLTTEAPVEEPPERDMTRTSALEPIRELQRERGHATGAEVPDAAVRVTAPIVGVFYRRPSPQEPAFVEVGNRVSAGHTVCLLESMKMFIPVAAPVDGTVGAIAVEERALVEFGQVLMWIQPESER